MMYFCMSLLLICVSVYGMNIELPPDYVAMDALSSTTSAPPLTMLMGEREGGQEENFDSEEVLIGRQKQTLIQHLGDAQHRYFLSRVSCCSSSDQTPFGRSSVFDLTLVAGRFNFQERSRLAFALQPNDIENMQKGFVIYVPKQNHPAALIVSTHAFDREQVITAFRRNYVRQQVEGDIAYAKRDAIKINQALKRAETARKKGWLCYLCHICLPTC